MRCLSAMASATNMLQKDILASKSSVADSGRSSAFSQISLAKLDMMLDSCAQYLRPSLYRSYAVEPRNERHKPTTKPRTVRRTESMPTDIC